jgi:hypothetical protein
MAVSSLWKKRLADGGRRDVVEEEVRLHEQPDARATRVIHGDLRFDAELSVAIDPDEARLS